VREVITETDDKAIIHAIITLARGLHLKVVAEGVETEQQLLFLRRQEDDGILGQGFIFGAPMRVDSLIAFLEEKGATPAQYKTSIRPTGPAPFCRT
jgi:EAL domain-containing protein (putative c-di-GMP-specific phosphodiesterase class I)